MNQSVSVDKLFHGKMTNSLYIKCQSLFDVGTIRSAFVSHQSACKSLFSFNLDLNVSP